MNGEEEEAAGRTEERERATYQIISLKCFLGVLFMSCKALIQINSQLAQLLKYMPELIPVRTRSSSLE